MKNQRVTIVGAGINGLVAANYLQRAGFEVTLLERKAKVGGAVSTDSFMHKGKKITYSNGASVLGFMQDFVYRETCLDKHTAIYLPKHPEIVYSSSSAEACYMYDEVSQLRRELTEKWGERGKVKEFFADLTKVADFLRTGYRNAQVPTIEIARKQLGAKLVSRWITGSAKSLLDYYFTSEQTKVYFSISATESGPVDLDSAYSAFSIPLMASGSIFDGRWGYVKGGIWQITTALGNINKQLGVKTVVSARVTKVSQNDRSVTYVKNNTTKRLESDYVIFATDPLSAAKAIKDKSLIEKVSHKELVGSSGKLVMVFKRPIEWTGDLGKEDFSMALRYFVSIGDLEAMDDSSSQVKSQTSVFSDAYFEVYCEGAGDRKLGGKRSYDVISVYFKNLSLAKTGTVLPRVKEYVERVVLAKVVNKEDLIKSILLTPKDLRELFYFPGGNIDHVELSKGQTFFNRTYSSNPKDRFYQFGKHEGIFYCAAGAYPCGSVAGTPGYMCAMQIINSKDKA